MAQINAGADFGQTVAQPVRLNETATPRAAFGVTRGMQGEADVLAQRGAQEVRAQQLEAARRAAEQQQAREAADRATAQQRMYTLRDRLADGVAEIERGIADGSVNKTEAGKVWTERSKALIDAGLPDIPEAHREFVRGDAAGLAERLTSKVGDAVRLRDRQDTRDSLNGTLEYTQRLAVAEPERARSIMLATLESAGPAAGLRPDEIGKIRQGWIEGTAYTRAFTAVNAAKNDNKALAKVEQAVQADADMDPQRKASLLAQVENYRGANEARAVRAAQHAEIVAARRERESTAAFNVLHGWMVAGKMPNEQASAGLIAKLQPDALAAYRAMAAEIPARTAAAMQPLDVQQQQLDALMVARNRQGTSQALEQEITRREQVLAQARKDYAAEPLRAAQERGVLTVPLQPLNTASFEALTAGVAARVEQAQTVSTRTGRPVSPLLSEEANNLSRLLQALPVNQRADRIAQVAGLLPPDQAQALAGQLANGQSEEKRALGIAFALGTMRTSAGRATSELALKGAEALKAKTIKEETKAVDGWRGQIAKQLEGIYVNPAQAAMAGEAARLVLAGLVAEGATGTADDAKQAVRLAVGGSLAVHNGSRVLVPVGIDIQDVRQRVRTMTPADLAPQAGDGNIYVAGQAIPVADFIARLPDAQLQYAGRGRYFVKAQGTYAANADREPIVIEVAR